jgi:hypothetical protein
MTDIIKSENNVPRRNRDMNDGTYAEVVSAVSSNITDKFRETFESWPSASWDEKVHSGDIVTVDGNAVGASYLVISSDPLSAGKETCVDTVDTFRMPVELAVGAHLSQPAWGQDNSIELIDVDTIPDVPDLEISSITQTTTTLTVTTVLPHNLSAGKRIGIRGCSNPVVNYPAIVVASVLSPNQFTVTGGPNATIPSQTVTDPVGAKGFVYFRPALSGRRNGTSLHFESPSAVLGFFYARASAGDSLPFASGTGNSLIARQAVAIATNAPSSIIAASPYTYAFTASNEYKLALMADRLQWSDSSIDSLTQSTSRVLRTQVVPNPEKSYKLRLKSRSEPSLTVPSAQIVSVSKAGTTTATVTTNVPHNLVTGDLIVGYGVRDVGTGFYPALSTPTAVTVTAANAFTVVWGTAATNTSFGGYISKVNAACPQPGALTMSIVNAQKTTLSDGQHQIVLTGTANWAGFAVSIGDYVNVLGCRDISVGATIGIDGAWKVANISTTTLTLVNIAGYSPTVVDFASVDCGGGVIKRTDLRVSYVRIFDFERQRVELLPKPFGDLSGSVPVVIQAGNTNITGSVGGVGGHDAVISGFPLRIAGRAATANYTAVANGDTADVITTTVGAQISKPYAIPEAGFNASLALTTTTAVAIAAAAGAGIKRHLTALQAINTGAAVTELIILDGATERWRFTLPVNDPVLIQFPTEITATANTALNANLSVAGTVRANFQGYTAP